MHPIKGNAVPYPVPSAVIDPFLNSKTLTCGRVPCINIILPDEPLPSHFDSLNPLTTSHPRNKRSFLVLISL